MFQFFFKSEQNTAVSHFFERINFRYSFCTSPQPHNHTERHKRLMENGLEGILETKKNIHNKIFGIIEKINIAIQPI